MRAIIGRVLPASVIAVGALVAGVGLRGWFESPPKAELTRTQWDFGKVPPGASLEHSFLITNSGRRPLRILNVRTDCACITVTPDKLTAEREDVIRLDVALHVPRRQASGSHKVFLETNDPGAKHIAFLVSYDVSPPPRCYS